jgi:hypothetical protein
MLFPHLHCSLVLRPALSGVCRGFGSCHFLQGWGNSSWGHCWEISNKLSLMIRSTQSVMKWQNLTKYRLSARMALSKIWACFSSLLRSLAPRLPSAGELLQEPSTCGQLDVRVRQCLWEEPFLLCIRLDHGLRGLAFS